MPEGGGNVSSAGVSAQTVCLFNSCDGMTSFKSEQNRNSPYVVLLTFILNHSSLF